MTDSRRTDRTTGTASGSAAGPCRPSSARTVRPRSPRTGRRCRSGSTSVGVRFGPPRTPTPRRARAIQSFVYFCQRAGEGSTWLRSRNPLVTCGPVQPSAHRSPVALSIATADLGVVDVLGLGALDEVLGDRLARERAGQHAAVGVDLDVDDARRLLEVGDRRALGDLVQERLPQAWPRSRGPSSRSAGCCCRCCPSRRRRRGPAPWDPSAGRRSPSPRGRSGRSSYRS